MKKDFFKKLIFFIISSCIFVSGCSFSGDDDNKALKAAIVMAANNSSSSEKVLVNLNFDTPRGGTMLPDQELTNLEFKGTRLEGGSFSTTADSKDDLCSKKIWLQTGKWNFTLSGVIDGVPFYDTLEEFELTKEHASLSFKLKPGNGISNGGLYLILNFTGAADSAELKVTDTETNVTVESQTYSSFESVPGNSEKKKIEYSKTFKTQDSDGLAPGTYLITVDFYRAGMKTGDLPLNTWKAYARIKAGLTAATEVDDYDLTDSYTITYHNVDTATLDSSGVAVACFSRKSGTITLPAYINAEGFNVLCWYETENFNISTPGITEFAAKNNLRNLDFYPLWDTDTAYAAAGGSGNGLTEANPASSVEAALSSLKTIHGTAYGSTQNALTVQIDGVVTGNTVIDTDYDEIAESLTLTGKTGNENDSLKGSGSGCVLELRTSKPVTLTKLKITGGSDVNYGGGIYICGNSSVILEDGALIEGNEANKQGGGIYVSRNTGASGRTSLTINAGAKISGNKIKEDETYGNNGGMAIYVYGAKVEMNGGEISQNNGQTINQRGAVRLNEDAVFDLNDGKITDNTVMHIGGNIFCRKSTINMKGGEISEGKAGSSTQNGSGGGLWIENNSSLNMTGGIICNNSVGPNEGSTGGAINIRKDGVKLTISGSAYIPSSGAAFDNDIYIQPLDNKSYKAVEIAGALTPPSDYVSAGKKIALTPGGWYRRAVILKPAAEAPSELKIEDYENYFTFTSSGVNYGYETNNTAIIVGPYYVADNGLDAETTSGDDQNPYKTLGYVVNMLSGGYDETIKVKGTLKGTQVIPSEFTTTNCKSLTIIGANGLDAQGNPKDVLTLADDAGSGSVLTINTQVPVTLKNIKITGGKGTPGELNAEFTTGGGIHTGQNATLKLADGVLITGNTVTLSGGGIYLGNHSDLYMYGSSYVGDNQQRLAVHDSSTTVYDYANAASNGGGIYNNGNVYLGYSGKDTSGNLIAADWTGGICRNCAGNGGGIDSSTGSTVKMRTGKISYNSAKYSKTGYVPYAQFGGGIYSYDTGAVEIIAGEISHNAAKSGGGIYIKDDDTVLKLTGGKMESNSADENGGAINYAKGKIEVSGNVYIPCTVEKQNDVYLAEDKFITIAGNLSLPADAPDNAKNVKITPSAWNRGAQVLGAATAALIADNKGHFATIDEDFTVDQKSGETTKGVLSAPIYVASSSTYDDTRYGNSGYPLYQGPRGTRAKPYCSLETALEAADASSHIIYIDGTFTGKTEISSTTLPNTDMLTLRGYIPEGQTVAKATLNGEFSSFGETNTTLIINGAKKVDIYDLTIKGGKNNSSDYGTQAAPGGGILINGSAEVTLGSGATITENTACYGGGVSVFNGKLTVNDGAVISKNTAEKDNSEGGYGGGIYVGKNGSLLLAGGMIGDSTSLDNGNKAIRGGGIYLAYNDDDVIRVEMTGGSVSHNLKKSGGSTRQAAGAGLYLCGKASISGGVIAHNITEGDCEGGGIYLPYQSVCTISGTVEISDNSANYGGGICSDTNDLTVEGGIFRNNNAEVAGGAILAYRVLYLKGNPVFYKSGDVIEKHKNDIDLYQYTASIRITGPVTTSDEYVAAVTPHDFKRGERLLSASSENISNMDAALSKFVLTKDNDGWNREKIEPSWDPSMRLYIINSPIYVVGTGHNSFFQDPPASGATGTKNMPYASIFAAEEAMDDSSMDYEVIVDGSITGPQKFSYSDKTSLRAKSVAIKGYKPTASYTVTAKLNGNSTGSALTIDAETAEFPVTIQDLTITGGSATNGGGINITKGTVKLTDGAKITGNTATSNGGGVYVSSNGTLFMYGKVLVGDNAKSTTTATSTSTSTYANKAAKGAGIYNNGGSVYLGYSAADSITDLTSNNTDGYYGVSRNYATDSGGGIYHAYGTLLIASGNISYNRGDSKAGAVYFNYYSSSNTETTLAAGTFKGNTSPMGGAFYIAGSKTVTISGPVDISSNTAVAPTNGGTSYAGAVYNAGTLKITGNATIKGNSASAVGVSGGSAGGANGGAIYNSGTLTITGSSAKISGNSAKVTVNGSAYGGGIHNTGNFILEAGSIGESSSLNYVSGPETKGGAVFQYNTFIMKSSGTVFAGTGTGLNQNDVYLAKKSTDATKVYCISVSDGALNSSSTAKITSELLDNGLTVIDGTNLATGNTGFTMADSGSGFNIVHSGTLGKLDIGATIYVSESAISGVTGGVAGDDTSGYGTQKRPFATIQKAAQKTWREQDYTISVNGTLTATSSANLQNIPNNTNVKATSITLTGTNDATINANSKGSAFTLSKAIPVTITNIKFTGGSATNGGGILVNGVAGAKLTLGDGVTITANNATGGAGIYFEGTSSSKGNLILKGSSGKISSISANTASNSGGGVYLKYANLCMSGYSVIGDTTASKATSGSKSNSAKYGGGVYCDTDATVWLGYSEANTSKSATLQSTYGICRNYASDSTYSGGGIYFSAAGTHYMSGGSINYNGAAAAGGGVYLSTGTLNIAGGTISNNAGTSGGGLYVGNSNSAIAKLYGSSVIDGNTATNGGGVYVDGATGSGGSATRGKLLVYGNGLIGKTGNTIASSSTYGNRATNGGGIYNKGTVCIGYSAWTNSSTNTPATCNGGLRRNYAGSTGGGICSEEDYIYLHAGDIAYNCSNANGGGIALKDGTTSYRAYVDMDGGTISYNQCESADGTKGAGIYAQHGSITVTGGTINNNTKAAKGGGVYLDTESSLYMKNASGKTTSGEISSNTATYGGAVYMDQCDTTSGINLYGAASIPKGSDEKNDIYVNATSSDKPKISISEVLTNSSISLVTGSSYFYVEGYSIVKGYDSNCTSCSSKLEIKSQSSQDWTITTASFEGTLAKAKKMTSSNISSFSPSSGINYNFVIDSTVSASDMKTFLEKLCNEEVNTSKTKIGSSSVLDLSKSNLTSIANMTFGNSSDEKLVEQTFAKVILPSTNCASMLANWRVRKCLSGAKSFEVAPGSTTMCTDNNGVVYNADKTKIIYYPAARAGSSYSWPTTVTEVGAYAFALTKNLTTMNIPNTVKTIGSDAFNSSSITSLSVPSSVTSMGDEVFVSCTKLVTASIDAPTVEHLAFGYCTSLTSITFGTSVKTIKQETINGCSALTTLTFSTTSGWKKDDGTSVNVSNFTQAKTALSTYVSGASCSLKR